MKNNKSIILVLTIIIFFAGMFGYLYVKGKDGGVSTKSANTSQIAGEKNYLLEEFPLDTVPLYKMKMVSASKYFVNKDPSRYADYFGKVVNYYNVVFETEATPEEYLKYYRSLMSEVNEDYGSESLIEGKIGKYKISASHYGDNPKNYGYLQVYLPESEYQEKNRYFQEYPGVVDLKDTFLEYESSYGFLNQKGGEVEYTQYFPLPKEDDEQNKLIETYKEKYQNESGYNYNEETGLMSWKKNAHSINMAFTKDHGRIYLVIRWPMDE